MMALHAEVSRRPIGKNDGLGYVVSPATDPEAMRFPGDSQIQPLKATNWTVRPGIAGIADSIRDSSGMAVFLRLDDGSSLLHHLILAKGFRQFKFIPETDTGHCFDFCIRERQE